MCELEECYFTPKMYIVATIYVYVNSVHCRFVYQYFTMTVSNIQAKKLFYDFKCPHCHQEPPIDYLANPEQEFPGLSHNPNRSDCKSFDEDFNAVYKESTKSEATLNKIYEWLWKFRM